MSEKLKARDIIITVVVVILFAVGLVLVLNIYKSEGEKRSASVSDLGEKDPNHIEVDVTLVTIDPNKGDIVARLEFLPKGSYTKADGTLARDVKLFVNGATGKQETDFPRGKKMNPMEVVVQMYDGLVTDYPFDKHKAYLEMYFVPGKPEKKSAEPGAAKPAEAAPSPTPKPEAADEEEPKKEDAAKKTEAAKEEEEDDEIPIGVDFAGSISGFKIEAAKARESQNDLVGIDMTISRAATTKFFSLFVMMMMWGLTISVLLLTLSVVLRGRKVELAMFSFTAALLFAFATVRNAQPGTPPIGTYSDFISFFWAEVIIALCLVVLVFTWLLRPAK
jgi:outer membrane biosynthesis protein TonB